MSGAGRAALVAGRAVADRRGFRVAVASLGLIAMTCLTFWPVLRNGFVAIDDNVYVTTNREVQKGLTWEGVRWAFRSGDARLWHPVTWLSHMLDVDLFGLQPYGHHLTNVVLHAANVALVYLALVGLTGAHARSAAVAGLFAVHPLRVESVAWIAERKDVLSAFFALLTLVAYAEYARRRSLARWGAVLGAYVLALLSKPMVVTLPLVLLLLDWWPLRRLTSAARLPALLIEKSVLFAAAAGTAIVAVVAASGARASLDTAPASSRLANAVASYATYLRETFCPAGLAFFYPLPRTTPVGALVVGTLLLGTVTVTAWMVRRRAPYVVVGWLWFVVSLLPVIGLVQAGPQALADRFTYLPSIGVLLAVSWAAADAARGRLPRSVSGLVVVGLVVALAGVTSRLIGYWRTTETLCRRALAVTSDNWFAHGALAAHLLDVGRFDEAEAHVRESLRLQPNSPEDRHRLGLVYAVTGRLDAALEQLAMAVALDPDNAAFRFNYAVALHKLGRLDAAISEYRETLRRDPRSAQAWYGLALALHSSDPAAAAQAYDRARALDPEVGALDPLKGG